MNESKVLATVNGKEITDMDVYNFLSQLAPQTAAQFRSPEGIKQLADELVNQELLYLEAIEKGFDKEEDFIVEVERVKANILKQYAINKLFSNIVVTEEEIENFYQEKKEFFTSPETVRASHILVEDDKKAEEILEEIKEGLSFEKAAEKYSSCPSKANGGDLGEFTRGKMVPEFEEAAFAMEEGEISQPVKTQFGYHIIKLSSKKEAAIKSLDEVKGQINQQLILMKQQERYLEKAEELKGKYEVKTYY